MRQIFKGMRFNEDLRYEAGATTRFACFPVIQFECLPRPYILLLNIRRSSSSLQSSIPCRPSAINFSTDLHFSRDSIDFSTMAPKAAKSTEESVQGDSPSVDASQESNTKFFSDFIRQHQKRTVERKALRKQEVVDRHNERIDQVKSKIAARVEKHDKDLKALRRPKIQHLMELTTKKRELENKIISSKAELEQACLSVANALRIALEGKAHFASSSLDRRDNIFRSLCR